MAYINGNEILFSPKVNITKKANLPNGIGEYIYVTKKETSAEIFVPEETEYAFIKSIGGATATEYDTEGNPIGFKHADVERVESVGKNLLPSDVMIADNWVANEGDKASSYYLGFLFDGWYCINLKLKEGYPSGIFFYLQKSTDGGETYVSNEVGYGRTGYLTNGYLVTNNGLYQAPIWFKVDKKAGTIYRLWFHVITQSMLDEIYDIQIERVNLAQEPSASYPPLTYAPPTEYTAYRGIIDSITIPEAVRSLEGYGREGSTLYYKDGAWWLSVTKDENLALLAEPIVTDLTDLFTKGNGLAVEGGGTIRFVNENEIAVSNAIIYATTDAEIINREGYLKPSGILSINESGTHDVTEYASVAVDCEPPSDLFEIYWNDEYDISEYKRVIVRVKQPSETLVIKENGTHDVEWYKDVIVKVPKVANLSSTTILERT